MKKLLLIVGLIAAALAAVPLAGAATIYNSVTDFSGTQGANGWSYAGLTFQNYDATGLQNMVSSTYYAPTTVWYTDFGGGRTVYLNATGQSVIEGNAAFSIRYWTADQDYSLATMTSTITAGTGGYGFGIFLLDAATSTTTNLAFDWISAGQTKPLNAVLANVKTGDRIAFLLRNGGASTSGEIQTWNQTVTVPEPAALSLLLLGGLALARRRR